MPSGQQLQTLTNSLSSEAKFVTDEHSSEFQEYVLRWSDIGRKTPNAIILPASENDCQATIKWAVTNNVPFVARSGGMSLYSTTGEEGIIIDLSHFASVAHDKSRHEAVLTGGISSKAVAVEVANDGCCTTLPSSNPTGAIPFFLNGGNSPLVAKLGYGSDNIICARMITAAGEPVNVSESENRDLLYAIRGAGQYYGLVTSLTVRTYPVQEVFGNPEGTYWSGRFVFPIDRASDVAHAMRNIVNNDAYCIGGLMMVGAAPPTFKPAVVITGKAIGPDSDFSQKIAFKPLYDLQPVVAGGAETRIENNADALDPLMAPGGFKKLRLTGIYSYKPETLVKLVELWQDLISTCPDAQSTIFGILFEAQPTPTPKFDSANAMHGIRFWAYNQVWCRQEQNVRIIERYLEKAHNVARARQSEDDFVDFPNSLREPESSIEHRHRGPDRLEQLRELKKRWDPTGVFGRELL